MRSKSQLILLLSALTVIVGLLTKAVPLLAASKETVLYSFCSTSGCKDGQDPDNRLIFDGAGNLYGITRDGGAQGNGTAFRLSHSAGGAWTETVLYDFCSATDCADGEEPEGGLIFDATGNLYGTTSGGGNFCFGITSCGVVFRLAPSASGRWVETVLYSFCSATNCTDGATPEAGLIFDAEGNLYGTTEVGGASVSGCGGYGCGTVFQLKLDENGAWEETVLHSFSRGKDGNYPLAGLIFDAVGNLYGTTYEGGAYGIGAVFQLAPGTNGKWEEKILHSFWNNGTDRNYPAAGLVFDASGNLYGTTAFGGAYQNGTVFELTPGASGEWKKKVLHSFNSNGKDGNNPAAALIFDAAGNLYGTTPWGGPHSSGTVFRLTRGENGRWVETVLYGFCSANNCKDGDSPLAGLIFDAAGNLYGTTSSGGAHGYGAVFEIVP